MENKQIPGDFVSGLLNDVSLGNEGTPAATGAEVIQVVPLHIDDLVPTAGNFYGVRDIESMKASILTVGVLQNLIVKARTDGKYDIYAGERRWTASKELAAEGHEEYGWVPCAISPPDEHPVITEYKLLTTNSEVRQKTPLEIVEEAIRAEENAKARKKLEKLPGRVREIAAETLGIKPTQMGQYHAIHKNLHPDLKTALHNGEFSINAAYELSGMEPDKQLALYALYKDMPGGLTGEAVKEAKRPAPKRAEDAAQVHGYHACMIAEGPCVNSEAMQHLLDSGESCVGCCSVCSLSECCPQVCGRYSENNPPAPATEGEAQPGFTVFTPATAPADTSQLQLPPAEERHPEPLAVERVEYTVPTGETPTREAKRLKLLMPYFQDVQSGLMTFNIRKNDRDYSVGDCLELREYTGVGYTGRACFAEVVYMLEDFPGIESGYCILGIRAM